MFFGRECYRSPEILLRMAGERGIPVRLTGIKRHLFEMYIRCFGVPDVGYQLRAAYFRSYFRKARFRRALDAGCGLGLYAFYLASRQRQATVDGYDYDPAQVAAAGQILRHLDLPNVKIEQLDLERFDETGRYDLAVCQDVIEHIEDDRKLVSNLYRTLEKGGTLYLTTPHRRHTRRYFRSLGVAYEGKGHIRDGYTGESLARLLSDCGFKDLRIRNVWGFWGESCEELYQLALLRLPLFCAAFLFPLLSVISRLDMWSKNRSGYGLLILARKED